MPQQLIYTSAPQGLAAGRSGHCTVARSASMREPLVLRLEQLSYYQHLSLIGGKERPIFAYRIVDIRGSRFHVLSRIQDAGLDFTARTNFIAHHLVLAPEDFRQFPTPPIILRDWAGWLESWTREPALLDNEDWSSLTSIAGQSSVPALTWKRVTGEAVNGYGLLEARAAATFRVDDETNETVLGLFAESIELLEVRDARRDYRAAALQYTFTTSMQEQDNPSDFRWRCVHSDNPAANRLATPDCRTLSDVCVTQCNPEEKAFACVGWQKPSVVIEPLDRPAKEGEALRIRAKVQGIPNPVCQWSLVDPGDKKEKELPGETKAELEVSNLRRGKQHYIVHVSNKVDHDSATIVIPVEQQDALLVKPASDLPLHLRQTSTLPEKKVWLEEKSPVKLSDSTRGKANRLWQVIVLISILAIGCVAVVFLKPAHRLSFERWLAFRLPFFRSFTNSSSTNQELTDVQKYIAPPNQVSATNLDNQSVNSNQNASGSSNGLRNSTLLLDPLSTTKSDLPAGWSTVGIGTVAATNVTYSGEKSNSIFSVSAAAEGFYSSGDNIFFVYTTNFGKEFKATLLKISPLIDSRCGIMIRDSARTNSSFLFIGASAHKISVFLRNQYGFYPWSIDQPSQPVLVKLTRQEGGLCGAEYFDAKHNQWLQPKGNYTVTLKKEMLIGFALNSGNVSTTNSADFEITSGNEH